MFYQILKFALACIDQEIARLNSANSGFDAKNEYYSTLLESSRLLRRLLQFN